MKRAAADDSIEPDAPTDCHGSLGWTWFTSVSPSASQRETLGQLRKIGRERPLAAGIPCKHQKKREIAF